jgi:tetratricopeptide (TPR) repeat protein
LPLGEQPPAAGPWQAHFDAAQSQREAGQLENAALAYAQIEQALAAQPEPAEQDEALLRRAQCERAGCLLALGRPQEAASAYRQALSSGPIPRDEVGGLARALAETHADDDVALAAYVAALQHRQSEGDDPVAHQMRAVLDGLADDTDPERWWRTVRWAAELLAAAPESPSAAAALGYVCARWGEAEAARRYYAAATAGDERPNMALIDTLAGMLR